MKLGRPVREQVQHDAVHQVASKVEARIGPYYMARFDLKTERAVAPVVLSGVCLPVVTEIQEAL